MPLINVIISLIVVGLLLWLVNNYIPMDGKIKNILNVVVVVAVVLWLLSAFGVLGSMSAVRVGGEQVERAADLALQPLDRLDSTPSRNREA